MTTPVKILLGLGALILVLFVALVITVTVIFEPDDYRAYLVEAVEDATGRTFELQGELGLSVFPCCAVSLGPARLGNPPGFPDDDFASLRSASLSLRLWPLLIHREVRVGTVTLEGVDASLIQLADGRANWEFQAPEAEVPPSAGEDGAPALAGLSVDAVFLTDGRVRYRDMATDTSYSATDVSLQTGAISYGTAEPSSFPLEAALTVTDERDGTRVKLNLASAVTLEETSLTLGTPTLVVEASGPALPGGTATADVSAETLVASLGEETAVTVEALTATLEALEARLMVTGHGRAGASAAQLDGELTLEETSPRKLLAALSDDAWQPTDDKALTSLAGTARWSLTDSALALHDLSLHLDDSALTGQVAVENFENPTVSFELALDKLDVDRYLPPEGAQTQQAGAAEPTVIPLQALAGTNVRGSFEADSLRLSGIDLVDLEARLTSLDGRVSVNLSSRAAGGRLSMEGEGDAGGAEPGLAGRLAVENVSPRQLLTAMGSPPDTANPDALSRFSGSARWTLAPTTLSVEDVSWRLDDTRITGRASVEDFDTLATRFDVTLDRMNLDDYLPAETADTPEAEQEAEIPVEMIRDLRLSGRLKAGELVMMGMPLSQVNAEVNAADGVMRLDPLTAGVYGGQYRGRVVIDATGPKANLTLDQELSAVQVSEVLQGFFDTQALTGSLSMKLAGSGAGNTPTELLRGLAANVSLDLSDGVYRGLDVVYDLRRARALLKNEAAPEAPARRETAIRTLKASGRMVDGVLQTRELSAETSALRLLGEGGINLLAMTLDYQLNAEVLKAAASAARLGDLADAAIPLSISGPLTSPKVDVDLKGLITTTLRSTVEQRARNTLMDRLGVGAEETPATETAPGEDTGTQPAQPRESQEQKAQPSTRDLLKRGLRDLLKPPPAEQEDKARDPSGV